MIAHRLSSLSNYDKIMVMEGGRLIEYGSPNELMNRRGIYY
jgi:ABC-type multidrug transport system fused ATPase/permease subunit